MLKNRQARRPKEIQRLRNQRLINQRLRVRNQRLRVRNQRQRHFPILDFRPVELARDALARKSQTDKYYKALSKCETKTYPRNKRQFSNKLKYIRNI